MTNYYRFTFFVLLLVLSACTLIGDSSDAVIKSPNDSREYQYIELPNQLKVLLISDPGADKAAASLDVFVGSRQDPEDYAGLAHFLEHMLFLGTEAYPDSGEYQKFMNSHNGGHNAYTSFEHTNYFFDIDPDYLDEALSRFSQFFVAPLFTEDYVDREKNAVHSEFMAKIKDDSRKAQEAFKTTINPQHPFSKFSVGNLDTLTNENGSLRKELLKFYDKNYSANIMALVVIGREPLAELEQMVANKFAAIPNKSKQLKDIDIPLFEPGVLPLMVQIKPEREQRVLSVGFSTPSVEAYYHQKPLYYIGNIIGHEGQGSLLSYLKSRGWAEGLGAGEGLSYQGGSSFNVSVQLTKEGVIHRDEVVLALFQAIERIRLEGIKPWLFNEQGMIAAQQFRYQEKSSPINYVSSLSSRLQYYPSIDVLYAPYMMTDFEPALLEEFLTYLTPDAALITLSAPEAKTDQRTSLYDTPYSVQPVNQQSLQTWADAGLNPKIKIPAPNEFIARNLELVNSAAIKIAKPVLEVDSPRYQLWYKPDSQFLLPKGQINFSLHSPTGNDTPVHGALLRLYARMIIEQLNEFSYPAYLAGLNYSLGSDDRGLSVQIGGFTDKQQLLLEKIFAAIKQPELDEQRFERLKRELIRQAENADKQQPYRRLMNVLPELIYKNNWSDQQLLSAYQTITLEQLDKYSQQFIHSMAAKVLVYGNYSRQQALKLGATLEVTGDSINTGVNILALPQSEFSYQVSSPYTDAVLAFYIQASELDKTTRAAMGVTSQFLRADFFNELRTEKQLGYVVTSGAYPVRDVPGIFFLVQSPVASVHSLQKEINGFIESRADSIDEMTEVDFETHRSVLVQKLSEKPKNMAEQSARYWSDLQQGYGDFDSRQQLIAAMEALTFDQWKAFFVNEVAAKPRRGLWLYAPGQFVDDSELDVQIVDDAAKFKTEQQYYSFD